MRQLKPYPKTITAIAAVLLMLSFEHQSKEIDNALATQVETFELKKIAFKILEAKCNVCHEKKNPRRVFTLDNMSELAPKIYKQVFVKKRMPKGTDIKLLNEEYSALEKWLFTQNII